MITNIAEVAADQWDVTTPNTYPFTKHSFLSALENSMSVGGKTGWLPQHLLITDSDDAPIASMPLYLKTHSYGEYVFDWSWAHAYDRVGIDYYPKLLAAIPFTPATGPRLCIRPSYLDQQEDPQSAKNQLFSYVEQALGKISDEKHLSSTHILFTEQSESDRWLREGYLQRIGIQYHWYNKGYQNFDHFLATFASRKRKNLRKERQRVADQGITFEVVSGNAIESEHWDHFYYFYQLTYAKRSGHVGYLNKDFFNMIGKSMPDNIVLILARHKDRFVAGALCFKDDKTLYGRYWGCLQEFDMLHFETCYYQGIDYCIHQGLERFDPGAQGEHKIQRGFRPVKTYSNHWIRDTRFRQAIKNFIADETRELNSYQVLASQNLPFKKIEENQ